MIDFGTIDMMHTEFSGHCTWTVSLSHLADLNEDEYPQIFNVEFDSIEDAESAIIESGLDFSNFHIYEDFRNANM